MITYQELRKIQAKERDNPELQELGEDFLNQILEYIHAKRNALNDMRDKESVFSKDSSSEIQHEIKNVMGIISDIYDRRQRKILSQVMMSLKTDSLEDISKMLDFEKEIYDKALSLLKSYRSAFFEKVMNGKPETSKNSSISEKTSNTSPTETIKKPHDEVISLKTTVDIPSFMWENGRTYGPFLEGDFVKLPSKVAEILEKSGKATFAKEE
jgi:DNA replication initiation complex subunit (GINS family)